MTRILSSVLTTLKTDDINRLNRARSHTDGDHGHFWVEYGLHYFRMDGDKCVAGWIIEGKWGEVTSKMYAIFEFIVHYVIPLISLVYLYGKVIWTSNQALTGNEDTTSRATQKVKYPFGKVATITPSSHEKYATNGLVSVG